MCFRLSVGASRQFLHSPCLGIACLETCGLLSVKGLKSGRADFENLPYWITFLVKVPLSVWIRTM